MKFKALPAATARPSPFPLQSGCLFFHPFNFTIMAHTPAPWGLSKSGLYVRKTPPGIDSMDWNICTMNEQSENYENDARLIAAAPELLEATKNLLNMIKMCGLQSPPEWEEKIERTITAARTAVEKATTPPEPNPTTDTWLTELIEEIEKRKQP